MSLATISGRCAHTLAQWQRPRWLVRRLIRGFARLYRINIGEAAQSLDQYPSLMAFFTRALKPGARSCDPDPAAIVAPVDGRIVACGYARDNDIVLVKGHSATLADVFGPLDDAFRGGAFIGIYLSPADCHRLYTPCAGRVVRAWPMGATLRPVYPAALQRRPDTPIRNQRIITELAHPHGRVLFAAIGALNVGRIVLAHAGAQDWQYDKGGEFGRFEFGSMVLLLFARDAIALRAGLASGTAVKIGERLALWR
jgi:phosphatidylserine decarboxylase